MNFGMGAMKKRYDIATVSGDILPSKPFLPHPRSTVKNGSGKEI